MSKTDNLEQDINAEINEIKKTNAKNGFKARFERAAGSVTKATGSSTTFLIALAVIIVWVITGPIFRFFGHLATDH